MGPGLAAPRTGKCGFQVCARLTLRAFRREQGLVGNSIATVGSVGSKKLMSLGTEPWRERPLSPK